MVRAVDCGMPLTRLTAIERSGVASENVVAVPASSAKTAIKSISFPAGPSTCFPSSGRQDSEDFCLSRLRTWSIKPNATESTR